MTDRSVSKLESNIPYIIATEIESNYRCHVVSAMTAPHSSNMASGEVTKMTEERKEKKEVVDTKEKKPKETEGGEIVKKTSDDDDKLIAPEYAIKHPLENKWALWFFKNDKTKSWADNLRIVTTFDTVEDFWAVYNHIQLASKLVTGCDYSLFKDGVKPMWEDDKNKAGGRWLVNFDKRQRHVDVDRSWLETLLCLVGEAFEEYGDHVNGCVINIRTKGDKIAIWTGTQHEESVMAVGRKFKSRLNLPARIIIGFESHADTKSKTGSMAKHKYSV
ncbi:eukaryotic translation initiation factor 4E-like [Anneissia japonica]|uniref:eukaryotic translation initiation factor 4E-like n=1 Tax=Anneissia japonica TaxID=1529436 RepID=UPI0014256CEF|nr:eukaryotic translation initiation factor 4E-like [Anneissia japonica]